MNLNNDDDVSVSRCSVLSDERQRRRQHVFDIDPSIGCFNLPLLRENHTQTNINIAALVIYKLNL